MTDHRVSRGRESQEIAAGYMREHGFPLARAVAASLKGVDIQECTGLAPEVKARRDFKPKEWMKQAVANAGDDLPFVVMRPDGMGDKSVADWPTFLRFEDFIWLVREAGYGDEL